MVTSAVHSVAPRVLELRGGFKGEGSMVHTPVMVSEVLRFLIHENSRRVLDGTVGCGGHARAILGANRHVELIGVDVDPDALTVAGEVLARYGTRVRLLRANFADLDLFERHGKIDGVLLDLGVSSLQIDEPSKGFSYTHAGPLSMRMSGEGGTAKSLIEQSSSSELARILREYGEVAGAMRVARRIVAAAGKGDMETTSDLRKAVESALGKKVTPAVLSKVFQAIRIALNRELDNIERFLAAVPSHLGANARMVVISYHSGEDKLIKSFLKRESADCLCPPAVPICVCGHRASLEILTPRVVKPSPDEIKRNPRARSARLRAARFLG